jgi:hypothetical protein
MVVLVIKLCFSDKVNFFSLIVRRKTRNGVISSKVSSVSESYVYVTYITNEPRWNMFEREGSKSKNFVIYSSMRLSKSCEEY